MLSRQESKPRGGKGACALHVLPSTLLTLSSEARRRDKHIARAEDGPHREEARPETYALARSTRVPILTIRLGRKSLLEQLKVHGRAMEDADPIFTKDVCRRS